jgi:SARP family transcriptional regulator, regulator of embCAB operon
MIFRVLGRLEARARAGGTVPLCAAKPRTLLGVLLAHANARVSTGQIIEALWDDVPPRSASANVQTYVFQLRRDLPFVDGRTRLLLDRAGYRLTVRPGELDLQVFEELAERGCRELTSCPDQATLLLRRAGELWRGEPFEDVPRAANEAFVQRLRERYWMVRETLAEIRLQVGESAELVGDLQAMVVEAPLRERLWELLMRALSGCGRRAEALACYQRLYRLLDRELGIEPGHGLRQLHQRILAG